LLIFTNLSFSTIKNETKQKRNKDEGYSNKKKIKNENENQEIINHIIKTEPYYQNWTLLTKIGAKFNKLES